MGMSIRDDVLRGLECVVCPNRMCDNCVYYIRYENNPDFGWCDRDAVYRDALSLLKVQKPRVMTLEEVKNLPAETDVWIQHAGKFADDVIRAATVSEVTNASISFWFGGSLYYMNYGEKPYGWICWTSRPTDEQREKVKWE